MRPVELRRLAVIHISVKIYCYYLKEPSCPPPITTTTSNNNNIDVVTGHETVSEYRKLVAEKYKSTYDWIGKVIYLELCNRRTFGHSYKWYKHKPDIFRENEKPKIIWKFEF